MFLLGTHQPGWLARTAVPLFVSARRLRVSKTLPRAVAPWALDSGGFTELQQYGRWTVTPADYVARVRRYRDEIGNLTCAAPQTSDVPNGSSRPSCAETSSRPGDPCGHGWPHPDGHDWPTTSPGAPGDVTLSTSGSVAAGSRSGTRAANATRHDRTPAMIDVVRH